MVHSAQFSRARWARRAAALGGTFAFALSFVLTAHCQEQPTAAPGQNVRPAAAAASQPGDTEAGARGGRGAGQPETRPLGLLRNEAGAFQGYTLIAPLQSTSTYLVDMEGRLVRTWKSELTAGHTAVLLDNGNLLRAGEQPNPPWGAGPGAGGRLQEFDWDGNVVWDFRYTTDTRLPHHDFVKLPNGNIVMVIREKKTPEEAIAVGRRPDLVRDGELQPDALIEVKPTGPTTGEIVWEWHIWDHLIQDHDSTKANFGEVAKHPELVDINFGSGMVAAMLNDPAGREQLRSIGYLGGAGATDDEGERRGGRGGPAGPGRGRGRGGRGPGRGDWTHVNSVAYNPELDQLMISVHEFSEIWIIDHSTTTAEAASHTGGRSGKGGDLLYRWGNPIAYRAGTAADQRSFAQHHAQWIDKSLPGAGHVLFFNNGNGRRDGQYSTVDEIILPVDAQGRYTLEPGKAYGPEQAAWSYSAPNKTDLFSNFISGAQRLPNGNTLICSGASGTLLEVTPTKEVVWQFNNPARSERGRGRRGGPGGGGPGGPGGFGGPGGPVPPASPQVGTILPPFAADALSLNDEQRGKVSELQNESDTKLKEIFNDEQENQLSEMRSGAGVAGVSQPGQVLSAFQQTRFNLTDEQKTQMGELQKFVDEKLQGILSEEQRTRLAQVGPGPAGGPGFAGADGRGGRGRGNRGGRGGGPQGNSIFRVYRYAAEFPGLRGKDLTPGKTLEEISRATENPPANRPLE